MRQLPSENSTPIELLVSANEAMLRLDQFMTKRLPEFSRSRLQQLIRDGFVRLNDSTSRPSQIVRGGDKIELIEPPLQKIEMFPEAIPVEILFEDGDLIVINKSPGLVVHPGAGHREHTLVNALLNHCATLSGIGRKERPGIVHHLGHPVLGDKIYAPRLAKNFPRQMLHAWKLEFRHPRTEEWKSFEAPLPDDFAAAIKLTIESQQV